MSCPFLVDGQLDCLCVRLITLLLTLWESKSSIAIMAYSADNMLAINRWNHSIEYTFQTFYISHINILVAKPKFDELLRLVSKPKGGKKK